MSLGSSNAYPYRQVVTDIEPEDVILLMTDDFPELIYKNGDMLGYAWVKTIFGESAHLSPDKIIKKPAGCNKKRAGREYPEKRYDFYRVQTQTLLKGNRNPDV